MMRRRYIFLPLVVLSLSISAAFGGEREDLLAAFARERADGKLEEALDLYRKAAGGSDPEVRGRARLGVGRLLRRLGRHGEARRELEALAASGLPAELSAEVDRELKRVMSALGEDPVSLGERIKALQKDATSLRSRLAREEGNRDELQRALLEKDALIRGLEEKLSGIKKEADEREKGLQQRAFMAAFALDQARTLYREARFDEAREWLKKALSQDPTNAEARELLARVGDTLGDRERLVREVFRLLDEERRLRLDELRLQVDALLSSGQELRFSGELDDAALRFAECTALIDENPSFTRELAARRERAEEFLEKTVERGAEPPKRDVAEPLAARSPENRWREILRGLLQELASEERPGGSILRVYDLDDLEDAASRTAPKPATLSESLWRPPVGDLLSALIPVLVHPAAWREGGLIIRSQGSTLVVHAPAEVQRGVGAVVSRLSAGQDPPTRVEITAIAVDPAALADAALAAGATFEAGPEGAVAHLDRRAEERLRQELAKEERGKVLGRLRVVVPPGRTLGVEQLRTVTRGPSTATEGGERAHRVEYGLSAAMFPVWTGSDHGLALAARVSHPAETLVLPATRGGEVRVPTLLTQNVAVATRVPARGAIALAGLRNPFGERPFPVRPGLLLLVRLEGEAAPAIPVPPDGAPPSRAGPAAVDLGGLDLGVPDEPARPFRGERPRVPESRSSFLLRYLREALGQKALEAPGASLTLGRGVVWVEGGEALAARVREALDGLKAGRERLVTIRVRSAAFSVAEEGRLISGLPPGGEVLEGKGIRVFHLKGDARQRVGFHIAGSAGRILLPELLAARSTQLVSLMKATRWTFLREYRIDDAGERWPIYGEVDEGLALELRPLSVPGDRIDLTAEVRVSRILDRGKTEPGPGGPAPQAPVQAISTARVRAVLAPGELLLVAGLAAPTPVTERRDRLIILLEAP